MLFSRSSGFFSSLKAGVGLLDLTAECEAAAGVLLPVVSGVVNSLSALKVKWALPSVSTSPVAVTVDVTHSVFIMDMSRARNTDFSTEQH